jgi:hypothetical protein
MSRLAPGQESRYSRSPGNEWRGDRYPVERRSGEGLPVGWLLTGLAVAGLGLMAWYYLGPDLKRYMKIRSM